MQPQRRGPVQRVAALYVNVRSRHQVNYIEILRWIHILAGASWLGEVMVVSFILVPALSRIEADKRGWFMATVFPRIFKLATILSVTTILAGAALNLSLSGWRVDVALIILTSTRWGQSILIGGALGLGLTLFHLFIEHHLEPHVRNADEFIDDEAFADIMFRLRIIPRVGLGVIFLIFFLMMFAAQTS